MEQNKQYKINGPEVIGAYFGCLLALASTFCFINPSLTNTLVGIGIDLIPLIGSIYYITHRKEIRARQEAEKAAEMLAAKKKASWLEVFGYLFFAIFCLVYAASINHYEFAVYVMLPFIIACLLAIPCIILAAIVLFMVLSVLSRMSPITGLLFWIILRRR